MEFSRQEYRSGLPFPSPGDLLNSGMEPRSPALQEDSLPTEPPGSLVVTMLKGRLFQRGQGFAQGLTAANVQALDSPAAPTWTAGLALSGCFKPSAAQG